MISQGCNLAESVQQCTIVVILALCEQHTFTCKFVVTQSCYLLSALFCRAALINEGCTLVESVLQDTVANHCAVGKFSNSLLH